MSRPACILGEPTGWHAGRLAALLEQRGFRPAIIRWQRLAARIGSRSDEDARTPPQDAASTDFRPARRGQGSAREERIGDGSLPGRSADSFQPPEFAAADVVVVRGMPGSARQTRLEEVIFRMDVLARLAARGTPVVNPPRALEIAIDKYLSLSLLAAAGLPVPETIAVQDLDAALEAWERWGGDCVIKPLFGSQGRGIVRGPDPETVAAAVAAGGGVTYLQEFVPHDGWDARVLVAGERVFAMRRIAPGGGWLTNLARGGAAGPLELPAAWEELARRAAAAVGASLAGVDILPAKDGRALVLEVNAVPGWRGLEGVRGPEVAAAVADHVAHVARVARV